MELCRDLKAENILFANKSEVADLKVIDFGLSQTFVPGQKFSEFVGTIGYMAPEMFKKNYGQEIDIWSSGVILYMLLCGFRPFGAGTQKEMVKKTLKGEIDFRTHPWPKISESAKNLISGMLESDPNKRLTAQQVLEHPWLKISPNFLSLRVDVNAKTVRSIAQEVFGQYKCAFS